MSNDHTPENCPRAIQLTERVNHNDAAIVDLKDDNSKQWDEINWLKKALTKLVPIWVTVVMMAMSFITGSALTYAGLVIKFSGK